MRSKKERILSKIKEFNKRLKNCKASWWYNKSDIDTIKQHTDIPHSLGSNYLNKYDTKKIRNKRNRLKNKIDLKMELEDFD